VGEIADMMVNGEMCSHCGVCFEKAYGYPVLCHTCYDEETEEERAGLPRATNKEL